MAKVREQTLRGGESPPFYKQIPLPIIKGKGTQGMGSPITYNLITIGVFSTYPDAQDKEQQPT